MGDELATCQFLLLGYTFRAECSKDMEDHGTQIVNEGTGDF